MQLIEQILEQGRAIAKNRSRQEDRDEAIAFIATADLYECKELIEKLADRVSSEVGLAPELEDAACVLERELASRYDEGMR